MLKDFYTFEEKTVDFSPLLPLDQATNTIRYGGIDIPSGDPAIFEQYTIAELRDLFDTQLTQFEEELAFQKRYELVKNQQIPRITKQYKDIYFYQSTPDEPAICFLKEDLLAAKQTYRPYVQPSTTPTQQHATNKPPSLFPPEEETTDDDESYLDDEPRPTIANSTATNPNIIGISKSAIRERTGYSWIVQRPWHPQPVKVTWQELLLESPHNIIVVDGSRQGGKSRTVAQKLIEESFIPGKDVMVAAFLQETTDSIGEYIISFLEHFDEGTFTIKERKRYIQNNESGVRIHFRTLKDGAKGIRGKTLRMIVVDEAMLISQDIFESILLPTMATIENSKLILLGTASENTSCYMYKTILDIRKGERYLSHPTPGILKKTATYIKFSAEENPFISPLELADIRSQKNNPRIQREYYNRWGKLEDSLFNPKPYSLTDIAHLISLDAHILLASDPARKQDRSGYSILHCLNGKVIVLQSGEIPPSHKVTWELQGMWLTSLFAQHAKYRSSSAAIDITGVGDGAVAVYRMKGLKVSDTVRYTSGDSESTQSEGNYLVGKSLLLNNMLDMISEDTLIIPTENNQLLLEEISFAQLGETRTGGVALRSDFFDDVLNSLLIGLYVAKKNNLINRSYIQKAKSQTFDDEIRAYNQHKKQSKWKKASGW